MHGLIRYTCVLATHICSFANAEYSISNPRVWESEEYKVVNVEGRQKFANQKQFKVPHYRSTFLFL